jgi:hypothetical protein
MFLQRRSRIHVFGGVGGGTAELVPSYEEKSLLTLCCQNSYICSVLCKSRLTSICQKQLPLTFFVEAKAGIDFAEGPAVDGAAFCQEKNISI